MTRFLTEPGGHRTGEPVEAKPCKCDLHGDRVLDDGHCVYCGRLPLHVIKGTWAVQDAWEDPAYAILMA